MIESALHFHRTKNFHFGSFKVQMGFQVFFLKNDQIYRSDLSDGYHLISWGQIAKLYKHFLFLYLKRVIINVITAEIDI
jgi:hypothetical protein